MKRGREPSCFVAAGHAVPPAELPEIAAGGDATEGAILLRGRTSLRSVRLQMNDALARGVGYGVSPAGRVQFVQDLADVEFGSMD